MRRRPWMLSLGLAVLLGGALVHHRRPPATIHWDTVAVRHGALTASLHEVGELAPRDPVLIKAPFSGRISFIVDDGAWVEAGDTVLILGEDDEVQRLTDDRSQLIGAQQDLRLAELKRRQATDAEEVKVTAATRDRDLEETRWRILSSTPVGGDELIRRCHDLEPLSARTATARAGWETAQQAFQATVDAYLQALDAEQDHRDILLRAQAHLDELSSLADASPEGMQAADRAQRDQAVADLPAARDELAALTRSADPLESALKTARIARDTARPARDQAAADLAAREADERDLRIRIEIEKRGVPLTLLKLDEEAGTLALNEAVRKRDQGRLAAQSGALARVDLEQLETDAASKTDELAIIRQKIDIASRPVAAEVLAEAQARRERATAKAESAAASRDRNLAILDKSIEVLKAKAGRLEHSISTRCSRFPVLLQDSIHFTEKELAALGPGDDHQRAEVSAELERLHAQLATAQADPPNLIKAPSRGICRLRKQDERVKQAGDKLYEEDVAMDLFPPANMEVLLHVNETNVGRIAKGMPALIEIPALGGPALRGTVTQVAGVGRDKSAIRAGSPFANVTLFDVHIALESTRAEFRQGMSALVSVELSRRSSVVYLPLAAVIHDPGGDAVWIGEPLHPRTQPIRGESYGVDTYIISDGLTPGQVVLIRRPGDL